MRWPRAALRGAIVPALLLAAGAAWAQDAAPMALSALEQSPPGSWAEYVVTLPGHDKLAQRYTLVGRTNDQVAVDIELSDSEGRTLVTTVFRRRDGRALSSVVRGPDGRREPVEGEQLREVVLLLPKDPSDGAETIAAAGRRFACRRYSGRGRSGTLTYWMSEEARPIGLVRLRDTSGVEITLASTGPSAAGPPAPASRPAPSSQPASGRRR